MRTNYKRSVAKLGRAYKIENMKRQFDKADKHLKQVSDEDEFWNRELDKYYRSKQAQKEHKLFMVVWGVIAVFIATLAILAVLLF